MNLKITKWIFCKSKMKTTNDPHNNKSFAFITLYSTEEEVLHEGWCSFDNLSSVPAKLHEVFSSDKRNSCQKFTIYI